MCFSEPFSKGGELGLGENMAMLRSRAWDESEAKSLRLSEIVLGFLAFLSRVNKNGSTIWSKSNFKKITDCCVEKQLLIEGDKKEGEGNTWAAI